MKIGVFVCNCGTNIAKVVDCDAVVESVESLPYVTVARTYKYMCSDPGQDIIRQDIEEYGLDRVVVAACSPRMHEPTFRKTLQKSGLNPYFLEMANIREQCSWVHEDPEAATAKASALTAAAVLRVAHHQALERRSVDMCPNCLIIGGGIAGITAALDLADSGNQVYLVERSDHLGGNVARVDLTAPYLDSARDLLTERVTRVLEHTRIDVFLKSKVQTVDGFVGNFKATIRTGDGNGSTRDEIKDVGSVVVCTGYKEFDAARITHYGYGKLPNVITSFEFEKMCGPGGCSPRRASPRSTSL